MAKAQRGMNLEGAEVEKGCLLCIWTVECLVPPNSHVAALSLGWVKTVACFRLFGVLCIFLTFLARNGFVRCSRWKEYVTHVTGCNLEEKRAGAECGRLVIFFLLFHGRGKTCCSCTYLCIMGCLGKCRDEVHEQCFFFSHEVY